jgi:hypothetical protein
MGLSKQDHFDPAKGPKRILALDAGGIRGIPHAAAPEVRRDPGQAAPRGRRVALRLFRPDRRHFDRIACGMTVDALQKHRRERFPTWRFAKVPSGVAPRQSSRPSFPPSRCNGSSTGSSARTRRSTVTRSAPAS